MPFFLLYRDQRKSTPCFLPITITACFTKIHIAQGPAKVCFPGSVNMRQKNCVLLPTAGWRTQFFHLIFTQPMGSNKSQPSTHDLGCRFPVNSADFWLCLHKFSGKADRGRLARQRREFKIHRKSTPQHKTLAGEGNVSD